MPNFPLSLDVIATRGEPRMVVVPIRIWRRLPARFRKRLEDVDTIARGREVTARLVPLRRLDSELAVALEDVLDVELAEAADAALTREVATRARAGVREAGIPEEVLRAEIDGLNSVAAWRKHRGMTQAQLASAAEIDRGYLALIERGARSGSAPTLARLASALGCLVDDLIVEFETAGA